MAAIENIHAWAKHEQERLAHQLQELLSGRLRTYDKHAHSPGWLEVDTTEHSIELCRHYLSELSAILALNPEVVPTAPAAPPVPRVVLPEPPAHLTAAEIIARAPPSSVTHSDVHPDWVTGWGVVKGQPPRWTFAGIFDTHAQADEAAAEAGEGYYARWGSYNERRKEFTSGPAFARPGAL